MRLSDDEIAALDATDHPARLKIGALLLEVREYRALRQFAEERAAYPMATWGEKKLAELVLRVGNV